MGISISSSSEAAAVVYLAVSSERNFLGVCVDGVPFDVVLLRVVRTEGDSVDELVLLRFILAVIQPANGVRGETG